MSRFRQELLDQVRAWMLTCEAAVLSASDVADELDTAPAVVGQVLREAGWKQGFSNDLRVWRRPGDSEDDETCRREAERAARLASDYEPLKPGDYAAGALNDGKYDAKYDKEKKQEYSKAMGVYRDELIAGTPSDKSAVFVGTLAEQERRHQNKRQARTVSIAAANEALMVRHFREAAAEHLAGKIEPSGFAARGRPPEPAKRSVVLGLSDLHLGSNLWRAENTVAFGAVEEARRLEYVFHEACEYKTRYRDKSELVLILNGDLIEGNLQHDLRAGSPLTEQKVVFWKYMSAGLGMVAARFPSVRVICQPGNHGRDKLRHPGRATSSKWDGHEWQMFWALREMAKRLPNVTFDIRMKPWTMVPMHGSNLLVTHGDTDFPLKSPSTKSEANFSHLAVANALKVYEEKFSAAFFGHFHYAAAIPGDPFVIYNGALVPPNGYARANGWVTRPCGQWVWESVPGFVVGDLRFISVGPAQDSDDTLGRVMVPFRFDMERS